MRLIIYTVDGLWLCGTALVGMMAFAYAFRVLLRNQRRIFRRVVLSAAGLVGGLAACAANPVINMAAFKGVARESRLDMLEDARRAGVVGQSTSWLQTRYGRPHEVRREDRDGPEHWWYTPGPWFVWHEDYVTFTVEKGRVTNAFLELESQGSSPSPDATAEAKAESQG